MFDAVFVMDLAQFARGGPLGPALDASRCSVRTALAPGTRVPHIFGMGESEKNVTPVLAAGGILVREAPRPLVAVVRLRKEKAWVLPKGKLKTGENALAAAKREVREETGHDVTVHEFLGSMSHAANRRHKVVQFWRMTPVGGPAHALTSDVKAVKWLPLEQAIETLTRAQEKVFLANVGPAAVKATRHSGRAIPVETGQPEARRSFVRVKLIDTVRAWLRGVTQQA
jgi:8-oxo-dGTP diphosphatase